jgi:hypothetical protein
MNPHLLSQLAGLASLSHAGLAALPAGGQINLGPASLLPLSHLLESPLLGLLVFRKPALKAVHHTPDQRQRRDVGIGALPRCDHWESGPRALEGHVRGWCREKLRARRGTRREQLTLITEGRIPGDLVRLLMEIEGVKRVTVY